MENPTVDPWYLDDDHYLKQKEQDMPEKINSIGGSFDVCDVDAKYSYCFCDVHIDLLAYII